MSDEMKPWPSYLTRREISHDEAHEVAGRLTASAFNRTENCARLSFPAQIDRDDDLLISAYIEQQRRKDAYWTSRTPPAPVADHETANPVIKPVCASSISDEPLAIVSPDANFSQQGNSDALRVAVWDAMDFHYDDYRDNVVRTVCAREARS